MSQMGRRGSTHRFREISKYFIDLVTNRTQATDVPILLFKFLIKEFIEFELDKN